MTKYSLAILLTLLTTACTTTAAVAPYAKQANSLAIKANVIRYCLADPATQDRIERETRQATYPHVIDGVTCYGQARNE